MKRVLFIGPILIFVALVGVFIVGLQRDPKIIPSVLIDRQVLPFALEELPGRGDGGLSSDHLKGEVQLVNIFGSWCVACLAEHDMLMRIRREGSVPIHGLAWNEKDPRDTMKWLAKHGDPYARIGFDINSRGATNFGVTGAPETFVIDPNGVIRYKHIGPITPQVWEDTLKPLIAQLRTTS